MAEFKPEHKPTVLIFLVRKMRNEFNKEHFEYVEKSFKKYFGSGFSIAADFVKTNKKFSTIEKELLFRNLLIMSAANEYGFISVDWDRFFSLKESAMVKTADKTIRLLEEYHFSFIDEWNKAIIKAQKERDGKEF